MLNRSVTLWNGVIYYLKFIARVISLFHTYVPAYCRHNEILWLCIQSACATGLLAVAPSRLTHFVDPCNSVVTASWSFANLKIGWTQQCCHALPSITLTFGLATSTTTNSTNQLHRAGAMKYCLHFLPPKMILNSCHSRRFCQLELPVCSSRSNKLLTISSFLPWIILALALWI